jgi:hypothetical protein
MKINKMDYPILDENSINIEETRRLEKEKRV